MKLKKTIAFLLALTLPIGMLVGCTTRSEDDILEGDLNSRKTINLTTSAVKTIDSVKATDEASFNIIQNTQETLLIYNENKPVPGAAKSYEVSDDGKTYTFHLRDNLKWSDGKDITAQDFKYAWLRLLNPDTASSYSFFLYGVKNAENYNSGKANVEDVGIYTPNDKTLVVELENPVAYFTQLVAFPALAPQRQDIVEAEGDKYGTDPTKLVYSGPFIISSWQRGSKMKLIKNPNYWDVDNVSLDIVNFQQITETNTAYQMFLSNQLDAIFVKGDFLAKLEEGAKEGKWNEVSEAAPSVFYNMFNVSGKNELLTNSKIRLAISIAMNREEYTEKILKSNIPAYGLVPDGISVGNYNYRDEVKQPLEEVMNEDPKALFIEGLKELGLDEDPSKYTFKYLLQGSDSAMKLQGEYVQNILNKVIGINIELVPSADFSDFLTKQDNGEFDIATAGWGGDYNDPMTFLDLFGSSNPNNSGKYKNARVDELLEALETETDINKRLEMYKEIEYIEVVEDPAVAPTYYKEIYSFQSKRVSGLQLLQFGGTYQLRWAKINE